MTAPHPKDDKQGTDPIGSRKPAKKANRRAQKGLFRADRITKAQKMHEALELRKKGHSYQAIATTLGVTSAEARALIKEAFALVSIEGAETAAELMYLQNERLESMYKAIDERIGKGDTRAVEVGIKILERQSRLHGLDAPVKQEVQVRYSQMSDDELLEEAKRLSVSVQDLLLTQTAGQYLLPGETRLPSAIAREYGLPDPGVIDAEIVPPPASPTEPQSENTDAPPAP